MSVWERQGVGRVEVGGEGDTMMTVWVTDRQIEGQALNTTTHDMGG